MNQRHFTQSAFSLLASTALHGAALLVLLGMTTGEPANSQALQGKTAALTLHMVSASSPAPSPDSPTERLLPTSQREDPLPVNDRGRRQSAATKPPRKTTPPQKKTPTSRPASALSPVAAAGQSANRGQDRQESEEGIAAQTSQRPMIGSGDDEKAAYAARLRSEIESHKRYPQRAKQARTGGVVNVRFNVGDDGSLTDPQLVSSSGNRDLDNAALQAVRQSNAVGPRPPGFGRSASVNIRFSLRG
ncbi:protein TonB [Serratia marcescens]|uniref:Protein TonB n=1 Tax=Serratia marcescens TaxID=615 RepID=A0A1C3HMN4_SERMA|nr:protein TonB [Serratia marcescens]BEM80573.1 protein TonB [Serratia marcescens]SAY46275.1 Ferric siderophore transporter TonB [Serratia marcescens]